MATLKEKAEEYLQEKEKHRKVKDVGRVARSAKERAAYRIISKENIDEINEDEITAFNLVKKDSVWEAINIDEQKELGVSAGACYIKVKIRECLPAKPENDAKKRKVYVYFLGILQNDLLPLLKVSDVREAARKYINIRDIDTAVTYFLDPDYPKYTEEVKEGIKYHYSKYFSEYDTRRMIVDQFGRKFLNILGNGSDSARQNWESAEIYQASAGDEERETERILKGRKIRLDNAVERLEKTNKMGTLEFFDYIKHNFTHVRHITMQDFNSDKSRMNEAWFRKFVEDLAAKAQVEYDKPVEIDPKYKKREDDWSWAGKATSEGGARIRSKAINTKEPLSYIKRVKGYKTPDPTPENVVKYYGFNAYNFGRYVPDKERAEHARHFIGALTDLAEILDIDIKQVHELVGLGFGVGLKGHGGHLAAYFPQTKDINLVRGKGDGSVAHEWGHFFDNMVSDFQYKKAEPQYGSQGNALDETLKDYFSEFRTFCARGVEGAVNYKTKIFKAWDKSGRYGHISILKTIDESIANLFEKNKGYSYWTTSKYYVNNQKDYLGYIIKEHGFSEYPVSLKLQTSVFYHDSSVAGVNSKYWTSNIEMFARCFETYIFHKLAKAGMGNNYLAHDAYLSEGMPYPRGAEYDEIEKIIDKIIKRFKEAYQIRPFTPVINERIGEEITEMKGKEPDTAEQTEEIQEQAEQTETKEQTAMVKMIRKPHAKGLIDSVPKSDFRKEFLREEEGLKIYLVDGEAVRKDHIMYVSGGHGYVYDWIPKDEVWIDENQKSKPDDMEATIKHELFEIKKMRDEGLSYDDAHELANKIEKKIRKGQITQSPLYGASGTFRISINKYPTGRYGLVGSIPEVLMVEKENKIGQKYYDSKTYDSVEAIIKDFQDNNIDIPASLMEQIDKERNKDTDMEYKYRLTIRPFDIGTYPKEGFVRFEPVGTYDYDQPYGTLVYNQKLPVERWSHFSLLPITQIDEIEGKIYHDKDGYFRAIYIKKWRNYQGADVEMYGIEGNDSPDDKINMSYRNIIENIETGYWIEGKLDKKKPEKEVRNEPEKIYKGVTFREFIVLHVTKEYKAFARRDYLRRNGIDEAEYETLKSSLLKKGLMLSNGAINEAGKRLVEQILKDGSKPGRYISNYGDLYGKGYSEGYKEIYAELWEGKKLEEEESKSSEPEKPKKYAKLNRDYNGRKAGTQGEVVYQPNMFVSDILFDDGKKERIDNTYLQFVKAGAKPEITKTSETDRDWTEDIKKEIARGFEVYKSYFRKKGNEEWNQAYLLSSPDLTEKKALQSVKNQFTADFFSMEDVDKGRQNEYEFKVLKAEKILDVFLPKIKILKPFLSEVQVDALVRMYRSEERQFALDKATELADLIEKMPKTYETDDIKAPEKIIYLHYFIGGSDWYIAEKDSNADQNQMFGYAILNGDYEMAEWGYVSAVELKENNVELDFYWTPKPFKEIGDPKQKLLKTIFGEPETEEADDEAENRKVFGYSFMFDPANDEGNELITALQGFGMVIGIVDAPNVITIEYRTEKYELNDNSGEFKVNRIGKEGYPDVIEFKDVDGKLKSVFNLAKEVEQSILRDLGKELKIKVLTERVVKDNRIILLQDENTSAIRSVTLSGDEGLKYNRNRQSDILRLWQMASEEKQPKALPTIEYAGEKYFVDFKLQQLRNVRTAVPFDFTAIKDEDIKAKIRAIRAEFGQNVYMEGLDDPEKPKVPETLGDEGMNEYERNKAIEKLLDSKWNDKPESWSAEQLEFIKGYTGYGGLDEEVAKAGEKLDKKSLFEFYTPEPVIEKMWGLAYKYGYNEGRMLEPSSGVGLFLKREYVKSSVIKDAYEINKYSAKICKLLYPEVNVNDGDEIKYFEQLFIKNNYTVRDKVSPVHSLVIGNPPYGEAQGRYLGMGEKTYTHAKNYIDYFIFRGLDLLVKDGLLIYIIGAEVASGGVPWLDQGTSKCKELIAQKGKLIDAYRLPEGLFARTNVVSDLVIFRKR